MADVKIAVVGGECELSFHPGTETGRNDDTRPGVGFMLESHVPAFERNGRYFHGMGVIGRKDAMALRDALNKFLADHPANV